MSETPKGLKMYIEYSKERFPVVPALILSAVVFYSSYFFAGTFPNETPLSWPKSIAGLLIIFLVTFHIRIFDEHKDLAKDRIAYPERLLSKGVITLKDLRKLLVIILIIEAGLSLYVGIVQFAIWAFILLYTVLMLKEFFVPEFLNRHMALYIISHQVIIPMILWFGFTFRAPLLDSFTTTLLFFMAGMFATITYEISRKTWPEEKEHELADSYSKFWGRNTAVVINQFTALAASIPMIFIYLTVSNGIVSSIVQAAFYVMFMASGLTFLKKPTIKTSKMLENMGALFLIGFFANAAISFYLKMK